jgi:hypothetical protein
VNRWLARIAAACTGLEIAIVVHAATTQKWTVLAASIPAAIYAAGWWMTTRGLIDKAEQVSRLEAANADLVVENEHLARYERTIRPASNGGGHA